MPNDLKPTDMEIAQGVKLTTMFKAMREITKQSSGTLDNDNAIGAGRRLERINMAAHAALKACSVQKGKVKHDDG